MKNRNFFRIAVIGFFVLVLSGCFPDNETIYDGPLQVEFRPTDYDLSLSSETTYSANIQLIGPHQDTAITVRYEIDEDETTAVRGVHFDTDGDTAQIPANSSFGEIAISANPDSFDGTSLRVVINLLGDASGDVKAAQNFKTLTLTLNP